MTTTQSQLEQIARECAEKIRMIEEGGSCGHVYDSTEATNFILTAANRIAALKVREGGAVEALDHSEPVMHYDKNMKPEMLPWFERHRNALATLRTIIKEGTPQAGVSSSTAEAALDELNEGDK
jgi:hypothetical protein